MSAACGHPLKTGKRICRNPVTGARPCAAGHPQRRNAQEEFFSEACEMIRTGTGWMCKTHDLRSENWQIAIGLGAEPSCKIPLNGEERETLAQDEGTDERTLILLSYDKDETVRRQVVVNPSTPPDILERLANDKDWQVRMRVARNPNTTPNILGRLANNEMIVRRWVAHNSNTPQSVLERLANDEDKHVRYWVAWNPNTPPSVLGQLISDEDVNVREKAVERLRP